MRALWRSLLLLSLAAAACNFNPKVDGTKLLCAASDDNACPSGYTCGADGHCCPGNAGTCTRVLNDGGNQDGHDATVSTGGAAAGGTTPTGGTNGEGGTSVGSGGAAGSATGGAGGAVGGAGAVGGKGGLLGSGGAAGNGGKPGSGGAGGTGAPADGGTPDASECSPPPSSCMGVTSGTLCMSNAVLSCSTSAKGCVSATVTATCTTAKPCVVNGGAASCTCPAPPADCTAAGKVCRPGNLLATCGLDSSGCLTTLASTACPSPQSCGGSFPNAACTCPAAPAECNGATSGSHCLSNTRVTCATDAGGCVTLSSLACGTAFCSGAYPGATCKSPMPLGFSTDLGSTEPHTMEVLLGFKITAPASTLYRFGILVPASAATAGAHVQFGLYRDGASAGPTTLVAQTNGMALASGRNEFAPTGTGVALTAGDYWIMAVFDRDTQVGHDKTTVATWRYKAPVPYGTTLPTTLGTTTPQTFVGNINYYLLVY